MRSVYRTPMGVLITGGAGFIGSHLAERLLETRGGPITLFDNFSTGRRTNVEGLADEARIDLVDGDVRDRGAVADAVADAEAVYHLAGGVGVQRVVEKPIESFQTNVHGTENVLEAAVPDTPVFLASTSEVYGKSPDLPFSEDDDRVLGPTSVSRWGYATAKAADEFLALAYHRQKGLPVVVGRLFNVAGPRQTGSYGMVVPTFVEQALRNQTLTVYGDGTQTRCFSHVEDVVGIIAELMDTSAAIGEVINIGSGQDVSINQLAESVIELSGSDSPIVHVPLESVYGDEFEESTHRKPDSSKLESIIGRRVPGDLDRILRDVIARKREALAGARSTTA